MKALSFILAFHILFLTGWHCADRDVHSGISETLSFMSPGAVNHADCAGCSPFCSCNCCTSPRISLSQPVSFDVYSIPGQSLPEIRRQLVSTHFNAIWQPPKIG